MVEFGRAADLGGRRAGELDLRDARGAERQLVLDAFDRDAVSAAFDHGKRKSVAGAAGHYQAIGGKSAYGERGLAGQLAADQLGQ
ncbi:MAG: hypothetical protein JJE27_02015 [Thermoleophilia bacterium]|nr:hypothetical protein [Thermoleophilia bacterium]